MPQLPDLSLWASQVNILPVSNWGFIPIARRFWRGWSLAQWNFGPANLTCLCYDATGRQRNMPSPVHHQLDMSVHPPLFLSQQIILGAVEHHHWRVSGWNPQRVVKKRSSKDFQARHKSDRERRLTLHSTPLTENTGTFLSPSWRSRRRVEESSKNILLRPCQITPETTEWTHQSLIRRAGRQPPIFSSPHP